MEKWTKILGFENYEISNLGNVKSLSRFDLIGRLKKEKLLKPFIKKGYAYVELTNIETKRHFEIHRLVAIAFIDNLENKRTVNHINGKKTDNRLENLEWNTYSENLKHAFDTKLRSNKGSKAPMSKITEEDVLEIRAIGGNLKQKTIAEIYKIDSSSVNKIMKRKTWTHI